MSQAKADIAIVQISRPTSEGSGIKILCVDDEPHVLAGLRALFHRQHCYQVLTAASAVEGLEILHREQDVAVIISDMRMPVSDGVTFLRLARRLAPHATRLVLSGQADVASSMAAINQGQIFAFLAKPCPPSALLAAVSAAAVQYRLISAQRLLNEHVLAALGPEHEESEATLIRLFSHAVRLFGCRFAALGLHDAPRWPPRRVIVDGLEPDLFRSGDCAGGPARLMELVARKGPIVLPHTASAVEIDHLPAGHPKVTQFLGVPLATVSRWHGWMYFADQGPIGLFGLEDALSAANLGAAAAAVCERLGGGVIPQAA